MKVFVVGEGRNDLGDLADLPQYRRGNSGYYQPLLRTMLGVDAEFDGRKIALLGRDQPKSRGKAARKKADFAVALAAAVEADLLVYSADGDNDFEARRRRLTADLEGSDIPWAVAMPKATLEAWILGDSHSLATVAPGASAPRQPESLWGSPHDPGSNHPKQVLTRLAGRRLDQADYDQAGSAARPNRLCTTCPESFVPFTEEIATFSGRPPCTP